MKRLMMLGLALTVAGMTNPAASLAEDGVTRIEWKKGGTFSGLLSVKIPSYLRPLHAAGVNVGDYKVRVYWQIKKGLPLSAIMGGGTLVAYDGDDYEAVVTSGNTTRRYEATEIVRLALPPGTYTVSIAPENSRGVRIGTKSFEVEVKAGLTTLEPPDLQ
jgi:hypothetical protein